MRHNSWVIGILVLSLAALLCTTTPIEGGKGGKGGKAGKAGPHPVHHPAHVGSVHYGHHPVVGVGGYRNPYRVEYFNLFRPGYFPIYINGAQYYGYYDLPIVCPPVVVDGFTYYFCDGIYYQPYIYNGRTVYIVAPF